MSVSVSEDKNKVLSPVYTPQYVGGHLISEQHVEMMLLNCHIKP